MNAKKRRQLVILLIALGVVLVMLAGVLFLNYLDDKKAEDAIVHVETVENLTGMTFVNGTEEDAFTAQTDEEGNVTWTYDADGDFPAADSTLNNLKSQVEELTASREISIEDDLSAYGLETPERALTLTGEDGTTATLLIGGTSGESYYCMLEGADSIYVIDSTLPDALPETLTDLAELGTFPALSEDIIQTVRVTGKTDQTFTVTEEAGETDGDAATYRWTCGDLDITEDSFLTTFRTQLDSVTMSELSAFKPSQTELQESGVLDPTAEITVTYTEDEETKTATLTIGNYDEDGDSYYCLLDGDTTLLYTAQADGLSDLVAVAQQGYSAASVASEEDTGA